VRCGGLRSARSDLRPPVLVGEKERLEVRRLAGDHSEAGGLDPLLRDPRKATPHPKLLIKRWSITASTRRTRDPMASSEGAPSRIPSPVYDRHGRGRPAQRFLRGCARRRPRLFRTAAKAAARARTLTANGITVWQDRTHMRGGEDYWQQIEQAIERCGSLVIPTRGGSAALPCWPGRRPGVARRSAARAFRAAPAASAPSSPPPRRKRRWAAAIRSSTSARR
jgi:hypothetical protein